MFPYCSLRTNGIQTRVWRGSAADRARGESPLAKTGRMVMATQLKVVSGMDVPGMDRQKALEAALAQIDRAFGKGSAMRLGSREKIEIDTVSTGSLGLDIALGVGGLPRGRVIEIYGPESSGKTT